MLATPLQLACSPWRGLSGGERTSAALCSPNETPVSNGACGAVEVRRKKIPNFPGCLCTTSWVVEETIEEHTAERDGAGHSFDMTHTVWQRLSSKWSYSTMKTCVFSRCCPGRCHRPGREAIERGVQESPILNFHG